MKISLNNTQLEVIRRALELYARLGIGQFEYVAEEIVRLHPKASVPNEPSLEWFMKDKYLTPMKTEVLGFGRGASYGVGNRNVHNYAHIAFDIWESIRDFCKKGEKDSLEEPGQLFYSNEPPIVILEENLERALTKK